MRNGSVGTPIKHISPPGAMPTVKLAPTVRKSWVSRALPRAPNRTERERPAMEAERLNALQNQLADLTERVAELRRYL